MDQWIFPKDKIICLVSPDKKLKEFFNYLEKKGIKIENERIEDDRVLLIIDENRLFYSKDDFEEFKKKIMKILMESMKKIYFYDSKHPFFEFSNFYPSKMKIDGIEYLTNEHYYQSEKFLDEKLKLECNSLKEPKEVFEYSRKYEKYIRKDWNEIKQVIMEKGLKNKFEQNKELKELLISTRNIELVEHSPVDFYWGDGYQNGKNQLGKLLMKLRESFIEKL